MTECPSAVCDGAGSRLVSSLSRSFVFWWGHLVPESARCAFFGLPLFYSSRKALSSVARFYFPPWYSVRCSYSNREVQPLAVHVLAARALIFVVRLLLTTYCDSDSHQSANSRYCCAVVVFFFSPRLTVVPLDATVRKRWCFRSGGSRSKG